MNPIDYYCDMYLDGVDSTTISQTVSALFGVDGQELSDIADAGTKKAKAYYAGIKPV